MSISEFYDTTSKDLTLYLRIKMEQRKEEIELGYDYTRRIMWASLAAMNGDKIKYTDLIQLSFDKANTTEVTPYQKQEMKKIFADMDKSMGL